MADRLQPGIYFRSKKRPPPCYRLLLLNVSDGADPKTVRRALEETMRMLAALPEGRVRELEGQGEQDIKKTKEVFKGFEALLGFGRRFFDTGRHAPVLTAMPRPDFLAYLARDQVSPALPWARGQAEGNRGEADIALQLTGHCEAATNRAVVEIWKLLLDAELPLEIAASFSGFGRPDGRGWLEFHDGVSNIESSERLAALEAGGDPKWISGGTYMAFLRLSVDLSRWRALSRAEQELIVGRDKLSGSPLKGTRRAESGTVVPVAAAPLDEDASEARRSDHLDPPQTTDRLIEASHTHRASQNRASPFAAAGLRIFRQGYDFLEDIGPEGPKLGLNFVSFQRDLGTLQHILHMPGWLGDVNFGGPTNPQPGEPDPVPLLELQAAGLYAVPPAGPLFPGAELFPAG